MENLVLRQQLAVYARRPKQPRLQDADRLFWSVVARTWEPWRSHLATRAPRDRHRLAPHRVAALLDMEKSRQASRATPHRSRTARADCPAGPREPTLGCGAHRRGTTRVGLRRQHADRAALSHRSAAAPALANVEHIPQEPALERCRPEPASAPRRSQLLAAARTAARSPRRARAAP